MLANEDELSIAVLLKLMLIALKQKITAYELMLLIFISVV